jgi:hypothetical protein
VDVLPVAVVLLIVKVGTPLVAVEVGEETAEVAVEAAEDFAVVALLTTDEAALLAAAPQTPVVSG